ncbi:hypothetical protein F503_03762 [Ophiostoma piceae UAMH 11346]|uniref:Uncharacterized protein n=1 Tax=Ophiostoma piceae (strain UAMH 11346) TaxID=1262450 RepID=S3BX92_OPHP1|nr:hypothetical protein F503_03762 [Ophiostoma piceae UAMH 11346]
MDLPIALRRTRRRASVLPMAQDAAPPTPPLTPSTPATPSRRHASAQASAFAKSSRTKRRVRFSDPGPATPSSTSSVSTGITPMIRRTSLAYGLDSPSSPVTEATFLPLRQVIDGRIKRRLRRNGLSEEMNLIYDEQRVAKREKKTRAAAAQLELEQLRSEVADKDREIERLRDLQDNDNDNEITIVQDNERVMALECELRILRNQIEGASGLVEHHDRTCNWTMAARDPFASSDMTELIEDASDAMTSVMTEVDMDDDVFGDTTMAELQCSTPSRRRRLPLPAPAPRQLDDSQATISFGDCNAGQSSFPTPPATSPAAWMPDPISPMSDCAAETTPATPTMHLFSTKRPVTQPLFSPALTPSSVSTAEVDVQACLPDPETDALREEVASLQRETAKLNSALEMYQSLVKVVEEKIASAQEATTSTPSVPSELDEQVTLVLRALSDKTAALVDLSKSLAVLGFNAKGDRQSDASEVVANLSTAFRTARLELEYLTPGEIELPLTAPAAQILDLLLGRLRTLSANAREAEARVDEYREVEGSLKEQLAARVSAMDQLNDEITERDALIEQKNSMLAEKNALLAEKESLLSTQGEGVAELEVGLDRLKGAVASYVRDMAELEALVQRLEKELAQSKEDTKRETETKKELEHKLAETVASYEKHQREMVVMEKRVAVAETKTEIERREKEMALSRRAAATLALNQNHGRALALRDARVQELRGEIEQVNDALRASHDTSRQLRVDNAGMAAALDAEKQRAQNAVATLHAELTRVSQLGKDLLGPSPAEEKATSSPRKLMTPGRRVSLGKSATVVESEKDSRKRRRYDSGLGFLDEDEVELF